LHDNPSSVIAAPQTLSWRHHPVRGRLMAGNPRIGSDPRSWAALSWPPPSLLMAVLETADPPIGQLPKHPGHCCQSRKRDLPGYTHSCRKAQLAEGPESLRAANLCQFPLDWSGW